MRTRSLTAAVAVSGLLLVMGCTHLARSMLFHPTHREPTGSLKALFTIEGDPDTLVGYVRPAQSPQTVWLMLHGNAGQAEDRTYALPCFPSDDLVLIMEYPGYGVRPGTPSRAALNQAAVGAYAMLRNAYPDKPVCVVGESIGSGPTCHLATLARPPDKIVLIVPFDRLSAVARDHVGSLFSGLISADDWDNVAALSGYRGPVDIFAAANDTVIPATHAQALAATTSSAKFQIIPGGHNEWSRDNKVRIANQ